MAERSSWDWIDPLGIRGSRWDPAVIMKELARGTVDNVPMVDVFGRLLKRLEGRRLEFERERRVTLVVGEVADAVPANEVVMGAGGTAVPIWRRVTLGVHSIEVDGLSAERAEITAVDVRFEDRGSQRIRAASVSARVLFTGVQFAELVQELDLPADVAAAGSRLVLRPPWARGLVAVEVVPSVDAGSLHLRPRVMHLARWRVPTPTRLPVTLDFPLRRVPDTVSVTDVESTDEGAVAATVRMAGVDLPFDLRRVLTDLGVEGARVVVRVFSGDRGHST